MSYIRMMRLRPAIVGVLVLLTGCFTGARPSVTTEPFAPGTTSGDPAIDAVLQQLDATNDGPYTADYTVLTKFGNTSRPAEVAIAPPDSRSVTVGDVRFLTVDGTTQTCLKDKPDQCSATIDPQRISDAQITPDFYARDAAKRLRRSAIARIGTPIPHDERIAGRPATCVDIPVPGGVTTYCALANGPLARLDDGAVTIDLTQFTSDADPAVFAAQTG
jgi:hypothetical protein